MRVMILSLLLLASSMRPDLSNHYWRILRLGCPRQSSKRERKSSEGKGGAIGKEKRSGLKIREERGQSRIFPGLFDPGPR